MKKTNNLFKTAHGFRFVSLATLVLLALFFISCNGRKNSKVTSEKRSEISPSNKITIGFSIDTLAIERWQHDLDVFMNKAKEMGADVIVQNAGNDVEEQKRQLLYLLDRNVNVVVVLPKEASSISDQIQKIKSRNIPVISYDRLTLNADIDLYMTIDSEKVGELMASGLRKAAKGPTWYCILGPEEDYNMTLIKRGINKIIYGSPVKIAHIFYTSGWNYDLAYQEMVRLITNNDIPDAIVCGNDAVADSVIQALTLYYKDNHIPVCGQDADIAACQYIVEGKQDFSVYKPITKLAELTAEYAVKIAEGKKISELNENLKTINNNYGDIPVLWLEPQIVNKSNIDEVIIQSGFHTYGEVYRERQ